MERRLMFGVIAICWSLLLPGLPATVNAADVLVRVNGEAITQDDLDFELMLNGVKGNQPAHIKQRKLEHLIERELVLQHLTKLGIKPDNKAIDQRIAAVKLALERSGLDPDNILPEHGWTPDRLRKFFSSSAMWEQYLSSRIDDETLKKYFESRKNQFDGTQVRASQIFLNLPDQPTPSDVAEARRKLLDYKSQIEQDKISFPDAAKKWSQAPSAEKGGDLDYSYYDGPLATEISHKVFETEKGMLSGPFQTSFGMHLIVVTDIRPGQFDLEDVWHIVRDKLYKEMWNKLVPELKAKAKVEYAK